MGATPVPTGTCPAAYDASCKIVLISSKVSRATGVALATRRVLTSWTLAERPWVNQGWAAMADTYDMGHRTAVRVISALD